MTRRSDSNPWYPVYESGALTDQVPEPHGLKEEEKREMFPSCNSLFMKGGKGWTGE